MDTLGIDYDANSSSNGISSAIACDLDLTVQLSWSIYTEVSDLLVVLFK